MTVERLRRVWHATPFRPFVFHLADGREIPVWRRDFMCMSPSGRRIIVNQPEGSMDQLELRQVAEIEVKAAPPGTNLVLIDPDLAETFPDAESVNRALRLLLDAARESLAGTRKRLSRKLRSSRPEK